MMYVRFLFADCPTSGVNQNALNNITMILHIQLYTHLSDCVTSSITEQLLILGPYIYNHYFMSQLFFPKLYDITMYIFLVK